MASGYVGAKFFAEKQLKNPVIVAPEAGGVHRAKHFRDVLARQGHADASLDIAMVVEQRNKDEGGHFKQKERKPVKADLIGTVANSDCIIVGDIIDTASSIARAAVELKKHGALKVYVFAPHGLFSGDAIKRIREAPIDEVVVTNTTPLNPEAQKLNKIRQISLAPLLAETIKRVYRNQSVSELFGVPVNKSPPTQKKQASKLGAYSIEGEEEPGEGID